MGLRVLANGINTNQKALLKMAESRFYGNSWSNAVIEHIKADILVVDKATNA